MNHLTPNSIRSWGNGSQFPESETHGEPSALSHLLPSRWSLQLLFTSLCVLLCIILYFFWWCNDVKVETKKVCKEMNIKVEWTVEETKCVFTHKHTRVMFAPIYCKCGYLQLLTRFSSLYYQLLTSLGGCCYFKEKFTDLSQTDPRKSERQ